MTKSRYLFIVAGITGLILIGLYELRKIKNNDIHRMKTIKTEVGWGYQITKDRKVIIYQESIPAYKGRLSFRSRKAAEIAGQLVLRKIKKDKVPGLSKEEVGKVMWIDNILSKKNLKNE